MRIDRMLSITVMLLNKERISAKELADKFEVSVRTVYRDIEAINLAGIPIVSYPGNNGGFGIMDNYKIDRQVLTLKDMIALLSALKGISSTLDYQDLDGAIEKIRSLVPPRDKGGPDLITEQLVIDILPWGYRKKQRELLKTIHGSISEKECLRFLYRNSKGESVDRTVEPVTLIFKGYAWYLFAYCRLKEDYRIFRLSRMRDMERTGKRFELKGKSYQEYMPSEENPPPLTDLTLKFKVKMRFNIEDYFDETQITYLENGDMIVKAAFPSGEWIESFVLSYGDKVEVLEPLSLRDEIRKKTEKILSFYQT